MSQNVYYIEYSSKYSNFPHRLEVYGYEASELVTPVYIEIPKNAVFVKGRERGFDKRKIGSEKVPVMKVEWNLAMIPDTAEYQELLELLLSPNIGTSEDFGIAGTIYRYYRVGALTANQKSEIFTGVVSSSDPLKYNKDGKLELKVQLATAYILKNIAIKESFYSVMRVVIAYLNGNTAETIEIAEHQYYWDMIIDSFFAFGIKNQDSFEYIKFQDEFAVIEHILKVNLQRLLRDYSRSFFVTEPQIKYYKIKPDTNSGELGIPLSSFELYQLFNQERYSHFDTLYDYFNDSAEEKLNNLTFGVNHILFDKLESQIVNLSPDEYELIEIEINKDDLNSAESSAYESFEDDISSYEVKEQLGETDKGFTVSIIDHNMINDMSGYDDELTGYTTGITVVRSKQYKNSDQVRAHSSKVFYKLTTVEKAALFDGQSEDVFVKVHEHCQYKLTPTINSTDLLENGFTPNIITYNGNLDSIKGNILNHNRKSKMLTAPSTLLKLYKGPDITSIKIKLKQFKSQSQNAFNLDLQTILNKTLVLDLSLKYSKLSYMNVGTKFDVTKAEYDDVTDMLTLTALNRILEIA